jgi:cytoskeletal protein CcmA (bactofilin family)
MWNKREEAPAPRPASATPSPAPVPEIRKEPTPVSSTPYRTPEADPRSSAASIGKSVRVVGQIFTKEDLYVDGDVEGTIESHENKVTIGPNGRVQASIKAREVIVLGQVQGDVETSDKVDLRKDAKLVGNITTARISIEDGALFKGSIDIKKPEPKPVPAAAAAAMAQPTPKPAAVPAATVGMGMGSPGVAR